MRNHYGRFIAISAECVVQSLPGQSAYVAGKRGMDGMLRVLAKEIGPYQITVNRVVPGWTITERVRNEGTARQDAYEVTVPLKRRGEDQEVAQVVAFLASDFASYIMSGTGVFFIDNPLDDHAEDWQDRAQKGQIDGGRERIQDACCRPSS
jgi:3-oxoacyl-[acyl-carrier protein] reductase